MTIVFIFRRDFRIQDNIALFEAIDLAKRTSETLIPLFMFNTLQIDPVHNKYFGNFTVKFMIESLDSLSKELQQVHAKLVVTKHHNDCEVLDDIVNRQNVKHIFFNRDYTPYARNRDDSIISYFKNKDINVHGFWNEYSFLDIPNMVKPYKVFSPFFNTYKHQSVSKCVFIKEIEFKGIFRSVQTKYLFSKKHWKRLYDHTYTQSATLIGGRHHALKRIDLIKSKQYVNYENDKNFPFKQGTTCLSPYLKYGCISIREVYWAIVNTYTLDHGLLKELYWRAFYDQMVYWFPKTLCHQLTTSQNETWSGKPVPDWTMNKALFMAVQQAQTGIPIIDAGLHCLYATGFMHNRLRMILCMYLIRQMKQDWRVYERWFATHAIDYYPASNRGGWEWALLYRFKFSPWQQTRRFDPDCLFIKEWIPKLKDIDKKIILSWETLHTVNDCYYKPLV